MPISFRAAGAVVTSNAAPASITVGAPAGVVATDVLLVPLKIDAGTITAPAGWTLILNQANGVNGNTAVYWALGNVASLVFTLAGVTDIAAFSLGYIGVDNVTPIDLSAIGQNNSPASTTATAPTITPVTTGAWGVAIFGIADTAGGAVPTFTAGAGLTNRQQGGIVDAATSSVAIDGADSNAGLTGGVAWGTHTSTLSLAEISEGISIILRPVVPSERYQTRVTRLPRGYH